MNKTMKLFAIAGAALVLCSTKSMAAPYVGANYGDTVFERMVGSVLPGHALGWDVHAGYRWNYAALEVGYARFDNAHFAAYGTTVDVFAHYPMGRVSFFTTGGAQFATQSAPTFRDHQTIWRVGFGLDIYDARVMVRIQPNAKFSGQLNNQVSVSIGYNFKL